MPVIVAFDEQLAILRCWGEEVQATQGRRCRAMARAMRAPADVVVDLGALGFADPSLMLDLAALARRLRRRGSTLRLRDAQGPVRQLIELVGLSRLDGVQLEPGTTV